MQKRRIDLYTIVVIAALVVFVPFAAFTFRLFKTGDAATGIAYDDVPAWGLGFVMLLGQGMMARAAIASYASDDVKKLFRYAWIFGFACTQIVVPLALLAGSLAKSIPEVILHIGSSGWLGATQYAVFFLLTAGAEISIPVMFVASFYDRQHAEEKAVTKAAAEAKVLGTIDATAAETTETKIKRLVAARRGITTAQLSAEIGKAPVTITKWAVSLADAGTIHSRQSPQGATWWPGEAQEAQS